MADFPVKGEKITVKVGDQSIEAKVTGVLRVPYVSESREEFCRGTLSGGEASGAVATLTEDLDWFQKGVRHDFCDRHPELIDALMRLTTDEFEEVRVLAAYLALMHP